LVSHTRRDSGTINTDLKENKKKNQSKKQSQNQSKNPEKEIIHREKERKGNQHTQRIVPAIAFIFADISAQKKKKHLKTNSQQAGLFIIFSASKAAEKTKGTRRQVNTEGR
jgi:hypothetical protein